MDIAPQGDSYSSHFLFLHYPGTPTNAYSLFLRGKVSDVRLQERLSLAKTYCSKECVLRDREETHGEFCRGKERRFKGKDGSWTEGALAEDRY